LVGLQARSPSTGIVRESEHKGRSTLPTRIGEMSFGRL
jgi:hypothetical protein